MTWKHQPERLIELFKKTDTSGHHAVYPARIQAQVFSAIDEFHASPGRPGNVAHFKLVVEGARLPPLVQELVIREEINAKRSDMGLAPLQG